MPKAHKPRQGSMQFWPRKRAKRIYPKVNAYINHKGDEGLLGFAGYKVGMTHVQYVDNRKSSTTKGLVINSPVTIIECPPLKVASIRLYKQENNNPIVATEIWGKVDKELKRKIKSHKKEEKKLEDIKPEDYFDIRINVYTQPKLTYLPKKKPELFEIPLAGTLKEKFEFAKNNLNKELRVSDVIKPGQFVDIHAVTKGKGFQGPVKRFGIAIRQHKSEKTKRGPGSLGGWISQAHIMYRVAHAGQMGFQTRTEFNKWVLAIKDKPEEINVNGGFAHYGLIKNQYILVKGGIPGAKKRLIRFNRSVRLNKKKQYLDGNAPIIEYVSLDSKQGK